MHMPIIVTLSLLLDALLGEPRRRHPLVGFGRLATLIERRLNCRVRVRALVQLRGLCALMICVVPRWCYACSSFDNLMARLSRRSFSMSRSVIAVCATTHAASSRHYKATTFGWRSDGSA